MPQGDCCATRTYEDDGISVRAVHCDLALPIVKVLFSCCHDFSVVYVVMYYV